MEFYTAERKKELLPLATVWMDLESIMLSEISQEVKQVPYDLTTKWIQINKTNKQAKQNQRHGNKEQTDSNQSGGKGGKQGKEWEGSSQGTCIKDPWTKTMGEGRTECGGLGCMGQGRLKGFKWGQL